MIARQEAMREAVIEVKDHHERHVVELQACSAVWKTARSRMNSRSRSVGNMDIWCPTVKATFQVRRSSRGCRAAEAVAFLEGAGRYAAVSGR